MMTLASQTPKCLVTGGGAAPPPTPSSLNLIVPNIVTSGGSSSTYSPTFNNKFNKCDGENGWKDNS